MNIELNQDQVNDIKAMLADIPKGGLRVTVRAINHTMGTTKTQMASEVYMRLNLQSSWIKTQIVTYNAFVSTPQGTIVTKGGPLELTQFVGTVQNDKGTSVKIKNDRRRSTILHAFILKFGSDGRKSYVYRRFYDGKRTAFNKAMKYGRLPMKFKYPPTAKKGHIERLTGPRIQDILDNPEVMGSIMAKTNVKLQERLDHEANYLLSQYQSKLYGAD